MLTSRDLSRLFPQPRRTSFLFLLTSSLLSLLALQYSSRSFVFLLTSSAFSWLVWHINSVSAGHLLISSLVSWFVSQVSFARFRLFPSVRVLTLLVPMFNSTSLVFLLTSSLLSLVKHTISVARLVFLLTFRLVSDRCLSGWPSMTNVSRLGKNSMPFTLLQFTDTIPSSPMVPMLISRTPLASSGDSFLSLSASM